MTIIESIIWIGIIFFPVVDGSFTVASSMNAFGLYMIYSAFCTKQ